MICSVLESLATSHQATSLVSLMHKSSQRLTSNRKLTASNHSRHTRSSGYFAILANYSLSFDGIQHHSFYNTYARDTCCFGRATKRWKLLTNFTQKNLSLSIQVDNNSAIRIILLLTGWKTYDKKKQSESTNLRWEHLTLWAVFTWKGIVLWFVYILHVGVGNGRYWFANWK